jgi:hypothetical protein
VICQWCSREISRLTVTDAHYYMSRSNGSFTCVDDNGYFHYHTPSIADVCRELATLYTRSAE